MGISGTFPAKALYRLMDRDYKRMMTWVAVALVASVVAAIIIVEIVVRRYGP